MAPKPLRILFVVNHADFFLSHRLPLARACHERGFDVHVATMRTDAVSRLEEEPMTWHELPLEAGGINPIADLKLLVAMRHLYRWIKPDVIHHVTIKPVLYGSIAARWIRMGAVVNALSGLGYLFRASGLKAAFLRTGVSILLKRALRHPNSTLILQNPDDYELFLKNGLANREQMTIIKGSGVDPAVYVPGPAPEGPPKVLLASRMLWDKGVGEFVQCADKLRAKGIAAQFILAGVPDANNPHSVPESQLRAWHAGGQIEWWKFCDDMPFIFRQVHVVCLPSYYGEGIPKVLIEASSCEKPIVTTDMPGCREIVTDGYNGYLVPARDVEALAQAIKKLLVAPTLRSKMGALGRQRVIQSYSLEKVTDETIQVYTKLLDRSGKRIGQLQKVAHV